MKIRKCMPLLLAALLAVTTLLPQTVSAASKYDDYQFYVTDHNEVTCTGEFDSLTSGYIVYYPADMDETEETYPLISWANGTMCAPALYYELLSEIAAGGYIVVANTELMAADGTDQVESIDFMLAQNEDADSIFYNRIDTENIGVAGHSQGGRSSVNAAVLDSRVDCVFSIAGSNFTSEASKLTTPTFFATGTADTIVLSSLWVKPAYKKANGPAVYASLKGAIHTTCCLNASKYSGYAVSWFDAYLKGDTEALNIFLPGGALSQDSSWTNYACKNF